MNKINDGGPAFPRGNWDMGMTLRDYFAAKAMQAIITGNNADECVFGPGVAKDAYAMADDMLAARGES